MKPILGAILSVASTSLSDDEKRLLKKYNPAGVALFSRNLQTTEQIFALTQSIKDTMERDDVIIALDEEGGRVDRLKNVTGQFFCSQEQLGRIGSKEVVKAHGILISDQMHKVGANFNFAPVLDLDYPNQTLALKSRTFSRGHKKTGHFGKILWQSYVKEGICPCIKHLPGHGRAQTDPHLGLPTICEKIKDLENDFWPFLFNKNCPAAMTAHILIKDFDDQMPVTFSPKCIKEIIRKKIGYTGFLISDALEMQALKGSLEQKTKLSFKAGLDCVCYCMGNIDEAKKVCDNADFLSDESLVRFEKIRDIIKTHKPQRDIDFIKETYYSNVNLTSDRKVDYDATEVLFQLEKGAK